MTIKKKKLSGKKLDFFLSWGDPDSGKVRGTSAALGHPRGLKLAKFCKFRKKWRVKSERKFEKTKKGRMKRCPIHQQTRHKNEPKGRDNSHEGSCY